MEAVLELNFTIYLKTPREVGISQMLMVLRAGFERDFKVTAHFVLFKIINHD